MSKADRIVAAISDRTLTSLEIYDAVNEDVSWWRRIGLASLHFELDILEERGRIQSRWDTGELPPQRMGHGRKFYWRPDAD